MWLSGYVYYTKLLQKRVSCAAPTDRTAAAGMPPVSWDDVVSPLQLAALYDFEVYDRADMHGDNYVTSKAYSGQRTRDNDWITFNQYTEWYAYKCSCFCG